ncbi:hypothetical protein HN51_021238 [Arachis hypogaea]|uniref:Uncharacterized protein n=2 Tax=Arachis hypogaea TaxID=3818 RepID=A0A445EHF7_ARAHY|nr:uncharacterized protein DS421_2g38060 [Arachis hypogaea]RYR74875.1 hypothetical protein Ahy_A02g009582 [Arachis hypogaea]
MAENSRETRRRRRILDQGSDRLAFITGRIQTLPTQPQPDSSSRSGHPTTTFTTTTLPNDEAEKKSDSIMLNHNSVVVPSREADASVSGSQTPLHEHEPKSAISGVLTSQDEHVQPSQDLPPDIIETEQQSRQMPQMGESKLRITPSEISSAIDASRFTRLLCSVVVAVLVVASYLGFSLMSSKLIKSITSFRPLYLVLVTDLSIVAARVLSGKQRGFRRSNGREYRTPSDGDQYAQLARTLELGLVMKNAMDAVFIDCAVYAIIVVCGISLFQT